jgi:hypothetical protein
MAAKGIWLMAIALALGANAGCCNWCDRWCHRDPPAGGACQCVPYPQQCCPQGGVQPVPAIPAGQNWQQPRAYSSPGCPCP